MTSPLNPEVNVRFRANGVGDVQRGLQLVGKEGEASAQKVGGSMRQIAGGVEAIARQGKVTGEAMKQILASGAEMAFMFGAAGPIVGGIAIVGLAIYEHITGNIKAARDEINKFRGDLEKMDFMAAATAQTFRVRGDPRALRKEGESNASFIARRFGAEGVRSRIEELRGQLPQAVLDKIGQGAGMASMGLQATAEAAATKEMIELISQLKILKQQIAEAAPVVGQLSAEIVQGAKNVEQVKKDEEAAWQARIAAAEAALGRRSYTQRLLDDPMAILRGTAVQRTPGMGAGVPNIGGAEGRRAFGIKVANTIVDDITTPMGERLQQGFADTIGNSIAAGISAGFQSGSITEVLKGAGGALLAGIGGLLQQEGALWIKYGIIKTGLMAALTNPFTSGPAAIAAGAALVALGAAISSIYRGSGGGGRSGGGYGGGSYTTQSQIIDRGIINPGGSVMSASQISPAVPVSFTVIGANDPGAQRDIIKLIRNAQNRGIV